MTRQYRLNEIHSWVTGSRVASSRRATEHEHEHEYDGEHDAIMDDIPGNRTMAKAASIRLICYGRSLVV